MTDYKGYLPHHRDDLMAETTKEVNRFAAFASVIGLAVLIWLMAVSCVDGVVREAERREQYEPRPRWASQTYKKPAAYRLSSPTQAEMDHVEHLIVVQRGR